MQGAVESHVDINRRSEMPRKSQFASFPDRKISETFLEFAEPILDPLAPDATTSIYVKTHR